MPRLSHYSSFGYPQTTWLEVQSRSTSSLLRRVQTMATMLFKGKTRRNVAQVAPAPGEYKDSEEENCYRKGVP